MVFYLPWTFSKMPFYCDWSIVLYYYSRLKAGQGPQIHKRAKYFRVPKEKEKFLSSITPTSQQPPRRCAHVPYKYENKCHSSDTGRQQNCTPYEPHNSQATSVTNKTIISAGNYLTEWSSLKEWQIIDLSGFDADNGLSHGWHVVLEFSRSGKWLIY